jgi:hypothetical protein
MPLVKSVLDAAILQAVEKLYSGQSTKVQFAKDLSTAIDRYIRTATIIVPPGQAISNSAGPGATVSPSPPAIIS